MELKEYLEELIQNTVFAIQDAKDEKKYYRGKKEYWEFYYREKFLKELLEMYEVNLEELGGK